MKFTLANSSKVKIYNVQYGISYIMVIQKSRYCINNILCFLPIWGGLKSIYWGKGYYYYLHVKEWDMFVCKHFTSSKRNLFSKSNPILASSYRIQDSAWFLSYIQAAICWSFGLKPKISHECQPYFFTTLLMCQKCNTHKICIHFTLNMRTTHSNLFYTYDCLNQVC